MSEFKSIHQFEFVSNTMLKLCLEGMNKDFILANRERVFDKYIDKYFRTWEDFSGCMSSDECVFSPIILCLKAEQLCIKPNYPVRVMRELYAKLGIKSATEV